MGFICCNIIRSWSDLGIKVGELSIGQESDRVRVREFEEGVEKSSLTALFSVATLPRENIARLSLSKDFGGKEVWGKNRRAKWVDDLNE